jgi:GTP-binding protein
MVGRSNVGKSSLINALARRAIARTSATPGKTRLANIYRVARGPRLLYLVDLPGYGYAKGRQAPEEFAAITEAYFAPRLRSGQASQGRAPGLPASPAAVAALLLVDSRHPGLASDIDAWAWLKETAAAAAVVATKIDKLARGERIRAMRELESVLEHSVLPVSAVTGEGLDELWILIDRLATHRQAQDRPAEHRGTTTSSSPRRPPAPTRRETAPTSPETAGRRKKGPRR